MGANTPMTKETQKFIKEINRMNELERAVQQYNAVVQQNKDLQKEVIHLRGQLQQLEQKYNCAISEMIDRFNCIANGIYSNTVYPRDIAQKSIEFIEKNLQEVKK